MRVKNEHPFYGSRSEFSLYLSHKVTESSLFI